MEWRALQCDVCCSESMRLCFRDVGKTLNFSDFFCQIEENVRIFLSDLEKVRIFLSDLENVRKNVSKSRKCKNTPLMRDSLRELEDFLIDSLNHSTSIIYDIFVGNDQHYYIPNFGM